MAYQISTTIRSKQRMQQEKNAKVCIRMATVFFAGIALIIEAAFKNNNPGLFDGLEDSFVFFLYPQVLVSVSFFHMKKTLDVTQTHKVL